MVGVGKLQPSHALRLGGRDAIARRRDTRVDHHAVRVHPFDPRKAAPKLVVPRNAQHAAFLSRADGLKR